MDATLKVVKVMHYTKLQSWTPPAYTHFPLPRTPPTLISVGEFEVGREGRKHLFKEGTLIKCHLQMVLVNLVVLFFCRLPLLLCSISLL